MLLTIFRRFSVLRPVAVFLFLLTAASSSDVYAARSFTVASYSMGVGGAAFNPPECDTLKSILPASWVVVSCDGLDTAVKAMGGQFTVNYKDAYGTPRSSQAST